VEFLEEEERNFANLSKEEEGLPSNHTMVDDGDQSKVF